MTGSRATGPGTAYRPPLIWSALCATGAALVLVAAGRTWVTVHARAMAGPDRIDLSGSDLVDWLVPIALAALAAAAVVLVTRATARRVLGAVVAVLGVAVLAGSGSGLQDQAITLAVGGPGTVEARWWAWPVVAALGGSLLVGAGIVVAVRGGRWPGMSSRYDRPGGGRPAHGPGSGDSRTAERAMWDALDAGVDPTTDPVLAPEPRHINRLSDAGTES